MANRTSKSDSNTFAREETQHHYSFSLTTDMNCISQNPRVPVANQETYFGSGVRVYNFTSVFLSIPFFLQRMASLEKEGDQWQMWEFIRMI